MAASKPVQDAQVASAPMSTTVLVPLRAPGEGKTRLSPALSADERAVLAAAMLEDVAAALRDAPVDRVVVVAGGPAAAQVARDLDLEVVLDPVGISGLDAALAAAARRIGVLDTLLVVTADLPRLRTADVSAVLDTDAEVVVAPTGDGGTGGLLRRPADAIATAYGPGSAARHLRAGSVGGRRTQRVERLGFRDDIDTARDLAALAVGPLGSATAALLPRIAAVMARPAAG